ncbi:MAG: hypothetical protein AMXMBFR82_52240 [Candidatus Hydrogenedentota bacterium]
MRTVLCVATCLLVAVNAQSLEPAEYIRPYSENPFYWQYKGEPILLLGGSKDDNLFQLPDLEAHLDEMKAAGGNVIRNTMSARQDVGFEVYPFKRMDDGKYDLDQWNDEYWNRFENCLRLCAERDIVIQIELWDRFDYSQEHWEASPWRPANNVNYSVEQSGLVNQYPQPAWRDQQPFFHTIAGMPRYAKELDLVRGYQERIVDKMLSYSLNFGNVLYCMDNETSTPPAWGRYWMKRIQDAAAAKGVPVFVTDMFDDGFEPHRSAKIRQAIDDPAAYTFLDISQVNSRCFDEEHWNRFMWVVQELQASPRPITNTKIYSDGETNWGSGTPVDGVERFWRNLIGGAASCRFHRPGAGIGLNDTAKACITAARKAESIVKFWDVSPHQELLFEREPDEAYLAANPGSKYVLYFTDGGEVTLDLTQHEGTYTIRWVSIGSGDWGPTASVDGGQQVRVAAPGKGGWAACIIQTATAVAP